MLNTVCALLKEQVYVTYATHSHEAEGSKSETFIGQWFPHVLDLCTSKYLLLLYSSLGIVHHMPLVPVPCS